MKRKPKPTSRAVPERVLRRAWQAGTRSIRRQRVYATEWGGVLYLAMTECARVILAWAERGERR